MTRWSANGRSHGSDQLQVKDARAQLLAELVSATDGRFAQLTPDVLHRRFRISAKECECMLLAEQGRRERALAERAKMEAMG